MTEKTNDTENDELIPVETKPEDQTPADETQDGDDDDDEEDSRLAQSEDDSEDEITQANNHDKRVKRRERQKKAREAAQREIEHLRQTVAQLSQRVSAAETQATTANVNSIGQTVEQQLAAAVVELQQAEHVIAAASNAGNGEDVVAAMRIRDRAIAQVQQLNAVKQQVDTARQQVGQPRVDPNTVNFAKEWMSANPWYDPQGRDRDSALTKAIDNELAREGYNPGTRTYWEELTNRVASALNTDGGDADAPTSGSQTPRRKAPPTGNTREHAPASTKKEIYVTPERKQAMVEAGVWDDPAVRQRYLKAYQAYDSSSAR